MKTQLLIETLDLSEAVLNTEQRTVRQRLIVAGDSLNKRRYSEKVLQESGPLFEGVKTYANHPSKSDMRERPERSIGDLTGWISNVIYENGALYGTRHFTATQAGNDSWHLVKQIVEGEAPPTLMGGSINAIGKGRKDEKSGVLIVESIEAVNSVDDVTTPAAGGGFERLVASADTLLQDILNTMSYDEWFECRRDYSARLQQDMRKARQVDAIKTAQAEADRLTETVTQLESNLEQAQVTIATLQSERDTARADAMCKAREVMVLDELAKVQLPRTWKEDLRNRLMEAQPNQWAGILKIEIDKAKRADVLPRVPVTGAGQQIAPTVQREPSLQEVIRPREGEDAESWGKRVRQLKE